MQTITIDIPEEILEQYATINTVKQLMIEDFVADEYQKGKISLRQGAKMLGLTYEEFMVGFLGSRKISFINGPAGELVAEAEQENVWLDEVLGETS
jgi:hypothetical protein